MKFICQHIGLSIVIDDKLVDQLCRLGSDHYPKEYGGLLVGRYVNDNKEVLIEQTVLPKKFKSSAFSFERGVEGLRNILAGLFRKNPSLIYVGEWHTHPDGRPVPSSTDSSALRTIAEHKDVFIKNPLLLIIGVSSTGYELGFYVLHKNEVHSYELESNQQHNAEINLIEKTYGGK